LNLEVGKLKVKALADLVSWKKGLLLIGDRKERENSVRFH
jgi:hypothetical protein